MGRKKIVAMLAVLVVCILLPLKVQAQTANVTPENFLDYFSIDYGSAYPKDGYDAFCMEGDFSIMKGMIRCIVVDKPVRIYSPLSEGDGPSQTAGFEGVRFVIRSSGAVIDNLAISLDESEAEEVRVDSYSAVISMEGESELTGVMVKNNDILFKTSDQVDSYGIYSASTQVGVSSNTIEYYGKTDEENPVNNNAIRVEGGKADIRDNLVKASLPSFNIEYKEVPAESGNWVATTKSAAVCLGNCNGIDFASNIILVNSNQASGEYNSVYAVEAAGTASEKVVFESNQIQIHSQGMYTFGFAIDYPKTVLRDNYIEGKSNDWIAGIGVTGNNISDYEASGNTIALEGQSLCYGIYINPVNQTEKMMISGNVINETAPFCYGIEATVGSLNGSDSVFDENEITLQGSNPMGMAMNINGTYGITGNTISVSENTTEMPVIEPDESILGNTTYPDYSAAISMKGGSEQTGVTVKNNDILFQSSGKMNSYGIYSDSTQIGVSSNTIVYYGKMDEEKDPINLNAIRIEGGKADIRENSIYASLPSVYVSWVEKPAGSGNWVSEPESEAISLKDCDGINFALNTILVECKEMIGNYDTIYAVDAAGTSAKEAVFTSNDIEVISSGTYAYVIMADYPKVVLQGNTIKGKSGYYVSGIDASGYNIHDFEASDNTITLEGKTIVEGFNIMLSDSVEKLVVSGNVIDETAPFCYGIEASVGSKNESAIAFDENEITMEGSNLAGIALRIHGTCEIKGNIVKAPGTNDSQEEIFNSFGKRPSYGMYLRHGQNTVYDVQENEIEASDTGILADSKAVICKNTITSGGEYAVKCNGEELPEDITVPVVSVTDNMLISSKYEGDESVSVNGMDVLVKDNYGKNGKQQNGGQSTEGQNSGSQSTEGQSSGGQTSVQQPATTGSGETTKGTETEKTETKKTETKKHEVKLTAKAKSFKVKDKNKKYTVTVKFDGKKKKGAEVTVKIKGKTYKAKTAKTGKAVVRLKKLTKKGAYTATVKVKVKQDGKTYTATKKVKIRVK
ncbi:MAG: hypothetical protein IKR58_01970 [Lachnospiraceae bacterium]|nr:hypothetical protein [Lachnospiraceae bacterium]